jgi:hypothetical protein
MCESAHYERAIFWQPALGGLPRNAAARPCGPGGTSREKGSYEGLVARMTGSNPSGHRSQSWFSVGRDVTLAPFLDGHRLVRDGVNDIGLLRALVKHPQVLA